MTVTRCRIYIGTKVPDSQRVPFGLGLEKTTGNSAWFLARMKCSTVKSSGEFSSAPTLHSSPPPPFVLLSPLFLFVVGRPSTSTIEVLRKRYTVLSSLESLSSHADIYALTPWFVKNYPRISRPALRNPLRDRSFSPPSDVRLRSRLPFSLRLLPSGIRAYFLLPRGKISAGLRVPRISCDRAVLRERIMARPVASYFFACFIASLFFSGLTLRRAIISFLLFHIDTKIDNIDTKFQKY